jgi:peptide deformylase
MIVKNIVQIGNPILNQKSKLVKNINSVSTKKVIKNLKDSVRYHDLVGLASSQINSKLKLFVTEVRQTPFRNPKTIDKLRIYINPRITWMSKSQVIIYEGCGSVAYAKLFGPVKRPETIIIKALDENGLPFVLKAGGLLSRVIQHEYDHLFGIEFTQKITDYRKIMSSEEYLKRH